MRSRTSVLLITLFAAAACDSPTPSPDAEMAMPEIDGTAVEAHVALLADDLYEGREAGKRGYALAARYVATQFRTLGLKPGNGERYFQTVPFRVAQIVPGSRALQLETDNGTRDFTAFEDYTSYPTLAGGSVTISAPLVFLGYGVNAPSIERNDYEAVDLQGKIAVIVNGAPASLPSEVRAFYRSGRYHKFIELEKHGAIGAIYLQHRQISSDAAAVRSSKKGKYWRTDEHGHPMHAFKALQASVRLLEDGARALFTEAPMSFAEMARRVDEVNYDPVELGISARISQRVVESSTSSDNVVAILEGRDPRLKDEYVILTAHLDGIGMGDEDGDNIYNGYYDNASGVGTMIEVARAFTERPQPPRRSIVFLATTAEEKGLLGADYFANNPPVPVGQIVANVNMDMVMFLWRMQDIIAFGARHSTLSHSVARAGARAGVEVSPDPFPERGYFTRSDQFPFVQQGIPAIFFATGFKSREPGADPEALYNDFMENHYHGPSDDRQLRFDTWSAGRVADMNYQITREIADAEQRPRWQKDDFFGEMYGTNLTRSD